MNEDMILLKDIIKSLDGTRLAIAESAKNSELEIKEFRKWMAESSKKAEIETKELRQSIAEMRAANDKSAKNAEVETKELRQSIAEMRAANDKSAKNAEVETKELRQSIAEMRAANAESAKNAELEINEFRKWMAESSKKAEIEMNEIRESFKKSREEADKETKELKESIKELRRSIQESSKRMDISNAEMDKKFEKLGTMLGGLGNNIGKSTENLFFNSLAKTMSIGDLKFDLIEKNVFRIVRGKKFEFDVVMSNAEKILILETKHSYHPNDIKKLIKKLDEYQQLHPQYANLSVIGAIAGMTIPDETIQLARENHLFVVMQDGNDILVLNDPTDLYN